MSIPLNAGGSGISSLLMADHFLPPDDLENSLLLDYENGGIGLNDPSEGLNFQKWILRYFPTTDDMSIQAANTPLTVLFNRSDITEISLAFDQNMNPFVAFVEAGAAKYWWFDPVPNQTVFANLPANSTTPRCCIDDKRDDRSGTSDIILCYVNDGKLYERMERERFTIARLLQDPFVDPTFGLPAVLVRVGMHKSNRLQWLCDLLNPIHPVCT